MKNIRVLCVDDNPNVCDSIELVMGLTGGFEWVGALLSADNLVPEVERLKPDVVLLDLDMPGRSPFGAVSELSRTCPGTRFVVCSGHLSGELVREALDAGCWGYVTKNENTGILVEAVRKVARGGVFLGPEVTSLSQTEE